MGFATGRGSVSALVVTSASMRERAVFIGSISVWDTIGTLRPSGIEIVTLFGLVYCRVMGRKARAWYAALWRTPWVFRRAPERLSALRPPLDSGWRS